MKNRHGALLGAIACLSAAGAAAETAHHWSYAGKTGPPHWAALEPDYAACGKGKTQSPINIATGQARKQDLPPLKFDYRPGALHIVDNGHTIQVNVPAGSTLTVGKDRYALVQFHFHHPSEETIDGKHFDMVAHLVHRDAAGHLAVVAVPLKNASAGSALIATLWHNLPHQKEHEDAPAKVTIDPAALLPASHSYYTYAGSLTTPPCSEGVRWFVLKSPVTISPGELATFAKIYPANARSAQPLNGRTVLASR
jgi:carbonic anhydrase